MEIGRDLLAMEISTIESDTITGRKMPWFPHAVIDVASKYTDWLGDVARLDMDRILALKAPLTPEMLIDVASREGAPADVRVTNGCRHLEQLRLTAKMVADDRLMKEAGKDPLKDADRGIAHRIRRNCDQLKAMVGRFRTVEAWRPYFLTEDVRDMATGAEPPGSGVELRSGGGESSAGGFVEVDEGLTRADISASVGAASEDATEPVMDADAATRLRKIWELGTDVVVAQTVVHIDGDTVTRLQGGLGEGERAFLLEIHHQAVTTATSQWKALFEAFQALVGGVASQLFGGRS